MRSSTSARAATAETWVVTERPSMPRPLAGPAVVAALPESVEPPGTRTVAVEAYRPAALAGSAPDHRRRTPRSVAVAVAAGSVVVAAAAPSASVPAVVAA